MPRARGDCAARLSYADHAAASGRTLDLEKFRALMTVRGVSLTRLGQVVGPSTVYTALCFTGTRAQLRALVRVCAALGCGVDEVTHTGRNAVPM